METLIKKMLFAVVAMAMALIALVHLGTDARALVRDTVDTNSWIPNVDYMGEIVSILENNPTQKELELAETYEKLRNAKIESLSLDVDKTYYFELYGYNADDILYAISNPSSHTIVALDEDVDLLARILFLECGSDWIPDYVLEYFCSVVVNRVNHWYYPDTLDGVLSQRSQFISYSNRWNTTPTDRCYTIAREILETGSKIPENVVYFAQFMQGSGAYHQWENNYFCYF